MSIKVLLVQRGVEPYKGKWAFPGGFMHIDETAEECARRELEEETGLKDAAVEQCYTFSDMLEAASRKTPEKLELIDFIGHFVNGYARYKKCERNH